MASFRILIVEDEVLIADLLHRYLLAFGHEVVGKAASYQEAIELYQSEQPDLVLLDIRLQGEKTGVDVACFIQEQDHQVPYIYLSSQLDRRSLDRARQTFPAGYLTKPIQKNSLYTTIEMALYRHDNQRVQASSYYQFYDGRNHHKLDVRDILYLEVKHVYVELHLRSGRSVTQRIALRELLGTLPEGEFLQTHRSFAINVNANAELQGQQLHIDSHVIPVSRTYRKIVTQLFRT